MEQDELNLKFQIFEQQIMQIQQQLQAVEQAIFELSLLKNDLDELKGKINEEILAPIGRGVFITTKLLSEELLVNVGNGNFIKKSIPETKKIFEEQIEKLGKAKDGLEDELRKIDNELTKTMENNVKESKDKDDKNNKESHNRSHNHQHPHNCKCKESEECTCGEDCECED